MPNLTQIKRENGGIFFFSLLILITVWAAMQFIFLYQFGIVTNGEATKYIFEAKQFLEKGHYSSKNFLFYSVQIMLIVFCLKWQTGYWLIVLIQVILNGFSVICFYKIVRLLTGRKWLPFVATLYFLGLYYYHLYNTYLYTESLFFSFTVIYTYVLFSTVKLNVWSVTKILFFLVLLYFTRPTGIFFIPATFLFLVLKFFRDKARGILVVSGIAGAIVLFFLLNYSLGSGGEFDFFLPYSREMILCGVPTVHGANQIEIPVRNNSIQGIIDFISHHFRLFVVLGTKRISAFFGVSRSYYSLYHNVFVSIYFYVLYISIVLNIRYLSGKNKATNWFMLVNILLMALTVMVTCDEWSNRFILGVTPFILLLAVSGWSGRTDALKG